MSPWLLLVALVALINLAALLVVRGRWGRIAWALLGASLLGTALGEAVGAATGLELVVMGDFHLVAASVGAQLAMAVTLLGASALPGPGDRAEGRR